MKYMTITRAFAAMAMIFIGCLPIKAYDFMLDGIYYEVTSYANRTVAVVSPGESVYSGNITIPERVINNGKTYYITGIGDEAFLDEKHLVSVQLPNSLLEIGVKSFKGCSVLSSVTIPDSVTFVGAEAFSSCTEMLSVIIGSSVATIGDEAFKNCTSLNAIYARPMTPPVFNNTFTDKIVQFGVLYVPKNTKSLYASVDPWRDFWYIHEEGTEAGVDDLNYSEPAVKTVAGSIVVENAKEGDAVKVFGIDGVMHYSSHATDATNKIDMPYNGVYVVVVGNQTYKVVL